MKANNNQKPPFCRSFLFRRSALVKLLEWEQHVCMVEHQKVLNWPNCGKGRGGEVWIEGCAHFFDPPTKIGWLETEEASAVGCNSWAFEWPAWTTSRPMWGSTSKGEEIRRKHCRLVSSHLCRQLALKMKENPQSIVWPISYLRKNFRFGGLSGNIPGLSLILKTWHF